jgi:hypothetical protein
VHQSVRDDVQDIFKGKSSAQLEELHQQILLTIESGAAMDVEYSIFLWPFISVSAYLSRKWCLLLIGSSLLFFFFTLLIYWEDSLKKLIVYKAQAKLKEIHASLLKQRLAQLEALQKTNPDQARFVCYQLYLTLTFKTAVQQSIPLQQTP